MNKNDNNNLISAEESNLPESGRELSSGFNASDSISSPRAFDNNTAFSATEDVSPVAFSGTQKNSDCSGKKFSRQEFIADSLVARAKEYNLVGELVKNADVFGIKDTLVAKAVEYGIEEEIAAHTKEYKIEEIVRAVAKEYSLDGVVKARTKEFDLTEKLLARAKEFGISEEVIARTLEYKIPSEIVARAKEFNLPEEIVARMTEIALLDSDLKASALLSDSSASISEEVPEGNIIPEENDDDFDEDVEEPEEEKREEDLQADFPKTPIDQRLLDAYADTVKTADELLARHDIYTEILTVLAEGSGKAHLSERLMLRSVDEIWVKAIEECINSLDELIRNPNHYIAETEEVLPIEKTKRISGRSVAHLCRHTDYISPNDKGEVTPTKMLNVFRDDSILTYENKFLNTLINRLYAFVGKRYSVLKDRGADERMQTLEFENAFPIGEGKAHVKVCVEYSERYDGTDAKRVLEGSGLMARVERVYAIVSGYVNSAFAKEMDKNFIRPPVMRTNAILKNKYFRECLALWEFIESYDDSGYGVTVDEKNKEISPGYAKELYKDAAMLYFMFRRNMDEDYGEDEKREYRVAPDVVMPDLVVPEEYREEFIGENADFGSDFDDVNLSLLVALAADDLSGGKLPVYRKSFAERLCDSDEMLKVAFAEICNEMSGYRSVKLRYSRKCATLRRGRTPLIRIAVAGKSLKMYFALDTSKLPEKYRAKDASKFKRYADTPSYIRIKSARSLKYALRICDLLAEKYELVLSKKPVIEINPDELNYEYFGLVGKTTEELRAEAEKAFAAEAGKTAIGTGEGTAEEKKINEKEIEKTAETESGVSDEISEKVPAEVDYPLIGVSFGSKKSETVEREAEAAERLAVKESGHSFEEEKPPVPEESDEVSKVADLIESLERVDSDYGKPTDFGLDDSSGFISDERRSESGYGRRKNVFGKRRQKK